MAALFAAALGLGGASEAGAQPSAGATAMLQFDKGRALMKEKKYAEACTAFEQSQRLDPQIGTLYNLGVCYAELGKLASSWSALREVGQRDANPGRKQDANRRAKALEQRLPKLLLTIPSAPSGLTVTMNGVNITALVGTESPVDPAAYKLRATAPGFAAWETTAKLAEGKTTTLAIELLRPGAKPAKPPEPAKPPPKLAEPARPPAEPAKPPPKVAGEPAKPPPKPAAEPARPALPDPSGATAASGTPISGIIIAPPEEPRAPQIRKRIAIAVGIGGVAALATGVVFGSLARGKWDEAEALCGSDHLCDDPATLEQGNAIVDDARMRANLSTGLVIGGAALVGAAAVLWLTAPSAHDSSSSVARALRIAPEVGPGRAGLTLGGFF